MTREEAIRVFKAWIERDEKMKYADRLENIEIYKMAIEALTENESLARSVNEASELLRKKNPRGEWIEVPKYKGYYVCSKCLERLDGNFERFEHWEMKKDNFCRVCGSDNRPKKDER